MAGSVENDSIEYSYIIIPAAYQLTDLKNGSPNGLRYNQMYPSGYNEPENSKSYLLVYNNRRIIIKQ